MPIASAPVAARPLAAGGEPAVTHLGDIVSFADEPMALSTGLGPDGYAIEWAIEPPLVTLIGFGATGSGDEGDAPQYIRGTVLDYDGVGVQRSVYALRRSDGNFMGRTVSSAVDGTFTIRPRTTEPVVLIAIPTDDEHINAVVLDRIMPVPD